MIFGTRGAVGAPNAWLIISRLLGLRPRSSDPKQVHRPWQCLFGHLSSISWTFVKIYHWCLTSCNIIDVMMFGTQGAFGAPNAQFITSPLHELPFRSFKAYRTWLRPLWSSSSDSWRVATIRYRYHTSGDMMWCHDFWPSEPPGRQTLDLSYLGFPNSTTVVPYHAGPTVCLPWTNTYFFLF